MHRFSRSAVLFLALLLLIATEAALGVPSWPDVQHDAARSGHFEEASGIWFRPFVRMRMQFGDPDGAGNQNSTAEVTASAAPARTVQTVTATTTSTATAGTGSAAPAIWISNEFAVVLCASPTGVSDSALYFWHLSNASIAGAITTSAALPEATAWRATALWLETDELLVTRGLDVRLLTPVDLMHDGGAAGVVVFRAAGAIHSLQLLSRSSSSAGDPVLLVVAALPPGGAPPSDPSAPLEVVAVSLSAADRGAVRWRAALPWRSGVGAVARLTLSDSGALLFAWDGNCTVRAWSAAAGAPEWTHTLPAPCARPTHLVAAPPALALLLAVRADGVLALRQSTGAAVWRWTAPSAGAPAADAAAYSVPPALGPDGAVYLYAAATQRLQALSPLDGAELWDTPVAQPLVSNLVLAQNARDVTGVLYALSAACVLSAWDSASGALRWRIALQSGGGSSAGVCTADNSTLALEPDGSLVAAFAAAPVTVVVRLQQVTLYAVHPAAVALTGGRLTLSGGNFADLFAAGARAECVFAGSASPAMYSPPNATVLCDAPVGEREGAAQSVALRITLQDLLYVSNALPFTYGRARPDSAGGTGLSEIQLIAIAVASVVVAATVAAVAALAHLTVRRLQRERAVLQAYVQHLKRRTLSASPHDQAAEMAVASAADGATAPARAVGGGAAAVAAPVAGPLPSDLSVQSGPGNASAHQGRHGGGSGRRASTHGGDDRQRLLGRQHLGAFASDDVP